MKKAALLAAFLALAVPCLGSNTEEKTRFGSFGDVTLYYGAPSPKSVVIFVSGDGGWNMGVVDMARDLASLGALVVGVDITHYLKELEASGGGCLYPAGDFQELSKFAQQKSGLGKYVTPILVGYSSGATLIYAALVQAPADTFKGGISLGFCPDLPVSRPFCKGYGLESKPGPKGVIFEPAKTLEVPWTAFQGTIDQVCDPASTEAYVKQVSGASVVMLPKVGHGYSVPKNWMPQLREVFASLSESPDKVREVSNVKKLEGLPLVEVPSGPSGRDSMVVLISGDGGWSVTEKGLSGVFSRNGVPVIGINSLHYFWQRRTPDGMSEDLARILSYYLGEWDKKYAVIIGYSMGADVAPFMISRLPGDLYPRVSTVVLLGPGSEVDLKFHLTNWIGGSQGKSALPVKPELEKLKGKDIECLYGKDDGDEICTNLPPGLAHSIERKGGHRVGFDYGDIANLVLGKIPEKQQP